MISAVTSLHHFCHAFIRFSQYFFCSGTEKNGPGRWVLTQQRFSTITIGKEV